MSISPPFLDFMLAKQIITSEILNHPSRFNIGSTVATATVIPIIESVIDIINNIFNTQKDEKDQNRNYSNYVLVLKGGLVVTEFLRKFTDVPEFGNSIDVKNINKLVKEFSDYDTTILAKDPQLIDTKNFERFITNIFTNIEDIICNSSEIQKLLYQLITRIIKDISTEDIKIVENNTVFTWRGFPISKFPSFKKLFTEQNMDTSYIDGKKNTQIRYTNLNNLYLVFKGEKTDPFRRRNVIRKCMIPVLRRQPIKFTTSQDNTGLPFVLDRILGQLELYEKTGDNFSNVLTVNDKYPFNYAYEILDISMDKDVVSISTESTLGFRTIPKRLEIPIPGQRLDKILIVHTLDLATVLYDFYNMFTGDSVTKPEKRCLRLLLFLKLYNLGKKSVIEHIKNTPHLIALFPQVAGLDQNNSSKQIDIDLSNNDDIRGYVSEIFPLYKPIAKLEQIILKDINNSKFIRNALDICLKTNDNVLTRLKDYVKAQYVPGGFYTTLTKRLVEIFEILKDESLNKVLDKKDPDNDVRMLLRNNIHIWLGIINGLTTLYNRITPEKTYYAQGGVKFMVDIHNSLIADDTIKQLKTLYEGNVFMSYDTDVFIMGDDEFSINQRIDFLKTYQPNIRIQETSNTNWEFLNNITDLGIYKKEDYITSQGLRYSKCQNDPCSMFFTIHNFDNQVDGNRPFKLFKGNVVLKHRTCDIYYVTETVDFNIVNKQKAIDYISTRLNDFIVIYIAMILLDDKVITHDEYLYMSCLFFYKNQYRPYTNIIRIYFYALKNLVENNIGAGPDDNKWIYLNQKIIDRVETNIYQYPYLRDGNIIDILKIFFANRYFNLSDLGTLTDFFTNKRYQLVNDEAIDGDSFTKKCTSDIDMEE